MNRTAWSVKILTLAVSVVALGATGAAADHHEAASGEAAEASAPVLPPKPGPEMSPEARIVGDPDHPEPPPKEAFGPDPTYEDHEYSAEGQINIYAGKHLNPTAYPPIELGRRLYDRGAYTTRPTWLGTKNPLSSHFMAYGDLRVAAAYNDNGVPGANGKTYQSSVAARLNLDLDLKLTDTERFHAFVRPFDTDGSFTRYDISGKVEDQSFGEYDFELETLYFEGDLGSLASGWTNKIKSFDLPFAVGLVPLITQNGVWLEDAFLGLSFALTAKNSPGLDVSNYDFTFFIGFDDVTSDAVASDDSIELLVGMAGFADLRQGYLEYGYGYVDAPEGDLSYHNVTVAFSKRYGGRVSNSIRVIGNFGQSPAPGRAKTADGVLLLIENSLITSKPSTVVPYFNLFAGWDTPQSLARDGGSGGVLRNTGINFETDGVTGYPTLDARGHDSYGGAFGIEYLFGLKRSLVIEAAVVERMGDLSRVLGSDYGIGIRFQEPLNNAWIVRFDAMYGWRDQPLDDITGARIEIRRKF